jgi:hypothetical protein
MNISPETSAAIQAIAGILSVLIAVLAVIISLRLDNRSSTRFEREQKQAFDTAAATVKPLLAIETYNYKDEKAVVLANHGPGTAVMTRIMMARGNQSVLNLAHLFQFQRKIVWNDFSFFTQEIHYIRGNSQMFLLKLSQKNMVSANDNMDSTQALQLLEEWERQLIGIQIRIEYEDVLGNRQKPCERIFKKST